MESCGRKTGVVRAVQVSEKKKETQRNRRRKALRLVQTHVTSNKRIHQIPRNHIRNQSPRRLRVQHLTRSRCTSRKVPLALCPRLPASMDVMRR